MKGHSEERLRIADWRLRTGIPNRKSEIGTPHSALRTPKSAIRWALAVGIGLLAVVVPACSEQSAEPAREAGAPAPAPGGAPRPALPAPAARPRPAVPAPDKAPPSGQGRRHPFVPLLDAATRRGMLATGQGPLELKGILHGPTDTAIIQEGSQTLHLHQGDHVAGLVVLEIREDEVVLGGGRQKRILSLYQR